MLSLLGAAPADAQVAERGEVAIGLGALSTLQNVGTARVYGIGGGAWLSQRWGIGGQFSITQGEGFAFSRNEWRSESFLLSGSDAYEYWMVTGRHRVFLNSGIELVIGVGTQLAGRRTERVHYRESAKPHRLLTGEERDALGAADEIRRERWGGFALALELLAGFRFRQHVGIRVGVVQVRDLDVVQTFQPMVLARVWF